MAPEMARKQNFTGVTAGEQARGSKERKAKNMADREKKLAARAAKRGGPVSGKEEVPEPAVAPTVAAYAEAPTAAVTAGQKKAADKLRAKRQAGAGGPPVAIRRRKQNESRKRIRTKKRK